MFHALLCQNASTSLSSKVGLSVGVLGLVGLKPQISEDVKFYGMNRADFSRTFVNFVYTSRRENI